jgi:hypothetical protein
MSSLFLRLLAPALVLATSQLHAVIVQVPVAADTTLFQSAPDNNLGLSDLAIGVTGTGGRARALLLFDVAALVPSGATITSASLTLYATRNAHTGAPAMDLEIHRALVSWTEGAKFGNTGNTATNGESTWNSRAHNLAAWGSVGGQSGVDFASATLGALGKLVFASTAPFVADAQGWLDTPLTNRGLFVLDATESTLKTARRFASAEDTSQGQSPVPVFAPVLTLEYSLAPIPEPSAFASLAGLAALALAATRRRR